MKKPILFIEDENGESEMELPTKWCICGQCDGEGKSSAYLGAYTWDEMEDAGEEFIEDYFAGNFDRVCESCAGHGKIREVDFAKITPQQRQLWEAQVRELDQEEAERRMEQRMDA